MEKQLLKDKSPVERIDILKSSADRVESLSYTKPFTLDQLHCFKDDLSTAMIELNQKEDDFKILRDAHKSQVKPLKEKTRQLLTDIKTKAAFVKEDCFVFIEGNEAGYYNAEGTLVYQRPLLPGEGQKTVFQVLREGTND
jgi:hypothetical protein